MWTGAKEIGDDISMQKTFFPHEASLTLFLQFLLFLGPLSTIWLTLLTFDDMACSSYERKKNSFNLETNEEVINYQSLAN